jgi:glycosyltransferase involved in cell wall biosynthesis
MNDSSALKITVIVTMYNRENQITKCLDSILRQSRRPFEVIVVDDASTDKSIDIVQMYNDPDKKIRLIAHPKNLGQNAALNTGYFNMKGDIVCFLDSDDEWYEDYLELAENIFDSNDEIDYIYSKVNLVNPVDITNLSSHDAKPIFYKMAFLASPGNLCMKREIAKSIFPLPNLGIYRRLNQDSYMNRDLVTVGKGFYLKKITLKKHVTSNSMSSSKGTQKNILKSWYLYYQDIEKDVIKYISSEQVISQRTFLSLLALSFNEKRIGLILYLLSRKKAKSFGINFLNYHLIYLKSIILFFNNIRMNYIEILKMLYNRPEILLKRYMNNL